MLEGKLIICDSNIPWHHNRYSKHHLMAQLAKTNEVVFVDPEEGVGEYLRRPREQRGALWRRWWYPEGEALAVFTPLQTPGRARLGFLRRWDERYYVRQIRSVVRRYPGRDLILFLGNAWHVFLLDAFPEAACTIYHCSDNFPAGFSGAFRKRFEAREVELIRRADIVACSHPYLVERCSRYSEKVYLLEHAVDERFFKSTREAECPADLARVPRPRAGFVGWLDELVDWDLLRTVAERTPSISYVLIGPLRGGMMHRLRPLLELGNVYHLGAKPWSALPSYLWAIDVGLMPFVRNDWIKGASPVKLFEYLAAGLAVVSTPLALTALVQPYVRMADSAEGFAAAVGAAVAQAGAFEGRRAQVAAVRKQYTWTQRARELAQLIDMVLQSPAAAEEVRRGERQGL